MKSPLLSLSLPVRSMTGAPDGPAALIFDAL
jgi:hypothetical protein